MIALLSTSAIACLWLKLHHAGTAHTALFEPQIEPIQSAPLCPWREPAQDMTSFFPTATRYEAETHILSGIRLQLADLLGRPPTGDENALHIYRVYEQLTPLGAILTQRVKGAYGAIELVLAVDPEGKVRGLRLQRNREPDSIAARLQRPEWLGSFVGKRAGDPWVLGGDIVAVDEAARISAEAIVQGVRSMLILHQAANNPNTRTLISKPHH